MEEKPKGIVFDIDLTLSDGRHRHHLIEDWDAFVEASINDPIFDVTVEMLNLYKDAGHKIILLTARDKSDYQRTLDWLELKGIHYDGLEMKEIGDNRSDEEIKKEIYHEKIKPFYRVKFAVDDRAENCGIFNELGIPSFKFCYHF